MYDINKSELGTLGSMERDGHKMRLSRVINVLNWLLKFLNELIILKRDKVDRFVKRDIGKYDDSYSTFNTSFKFLG